jgi:hypothetical protein
MVTHHPDMPFVQQPPELGNQYSADRALRSCLARALPADMLAADSRRLARND